jgi:hypothetical protein
MELSAGHLFFQQPFFFIMGFFSLDLGGDFFLVIQPTP